MDLVKLKEEHQNKREEAPSMTEIKSKKKTQQIEKDANLKFEKRSKEIPLEYVLDTGEVKKVKIISKVMDSKARLEYERVLTALADGVYFDNLPLEVKNRH